MDLNKYCLFSNKILENNRIVRFMYREKNNDEKDSGWRFFSGDENQIYVDNPANFYSISLKDFIENFDSSVQQHLNCGIGSALEKESDNNNFVLSKGFKFYENLN